MKASLVSLFHAHPKFYAMYVITVTECADFLLVYNTSIYAALYIKNIIGETRDATAFFFSSLPPFSFFILQSSLLSGHVTSTVVDVCSHSTYSKKDGGSCLCMDHLLPLQPWQ